MPRAIVFPVVFALAASAARAAEVARVDLAIPQPDAAGAGMARFLHESGVPRALDLRDDEIGPLAYQLGAAGATVESLRRAYPEDAAAGVGEVLSARARRLAEESQSYRLPTEWAAMRALPAQILDGDAAFKLLMAEIMGHKRADPAALDGLDSWRALFDGQRAQAPESLQPWTRKLFGLSAEEETLLAEMRRVDALMGRGVPASRIRLSPAVMAQNASFVDAVAERLRRLEAGWRDSPLSRSPGEREREVFSAWSGWLADRLAAQEEDRRRLAAGQVTLAEWNRMAESALLSLRGARLMEHLAKSDAALLTTNAFTTAWDGPEWENWTGKLRGMGGEMLFSPVALGPRFFTDSGGLDVFPAGLSLTAVRGDSVTREPEVFATHDSSHARLRMEAKRELMDFARIDEKTLRAERLRFLQRVREKYASRPEIERAQLEFVLFFVEQELAYPAHPKALRAYDRVRIKRMSFFQLPVDRNLPTAEFVLGVMKYRVLHSGDGDLNLELARRDFREDVIRRILREEFEQLQP